MSRPPLPGGPLLLVPGAALVVLGLLATPEGLSSWIGRLAADGEVEFFGTSRTAAVRWAIVAAGVVVAAWPWLSRRVPERDGDATAGDATAGDATAGDVPRAGAWLAAILVLFVAAGWARANHAPPYTTDAKFYLAEALDIAEEGGPAALPGRCFRAEYTESNRHPAYLAALAAVSEESPRFPYRARLIALAGAALAIVLVYRLAARLRGRAAGLAAAALLATGAAFRFHAVAVACEAWFVAAGLAWFDRLARDPEEDLGAGLRRAAALGALAAVAWLVKGTGAILFAATVMHLALRRGRRGPLELVVAALVFAVVGAPLLWRNAALHGNPFFNVNTSRVMWLDDYDQFRVAALREGAGPGRWLEEHTLADGVGRLAIGAPKTVSDLVDAVSPVGGEAGMAAGLAVLALALLGLRLRPREPGGAPRATMMAVLLVYLLSLAWYAEIATGARFPLALAPVLLVPAGAALARLVGGGRVVAAAALVALAAHAVRDGVHRPPPDRAPSPVAEEVHTWLRGRLGSHPHLHHALGPSPGLELDWDLALQGDRHPLPGSASEWRALNSLLWGHELRAVVVDRAGLAATGCTWARWDERAGLVPADVPPGWEVAARFPEGRPLALIFVPAP